MNAQHMRLSSSTSSDSVRGGLARWNRSGWSATDIVAIPRSPSRLVIPWPPGMPVSRSRTCLAWGARAGLAAQGRAVRAARR